MTENLNRVNTRLSGIKGFYSAEIREESVLSAMRDIAKELKFTINDEIEVVANLEVSDLIVATIPLGQVKPEKALDNSVWTDAAKLPKVCEKMASIGFYCSVLKVHNNVMKIVFLKALNDFDYVE